MDGPLRRQLLDGGAVLVLSNELPSTRMRINAAWCVTAMIAIDLLRWFALLCLTTSA